MDELFKDLFQNHVKSIERHRSNVKRALKKFATSELAAELDFSMSDIENIASIHDKDKCDPDGQFAEEYAIISGVYDGILDEEDYPYNEKLDAATMWHRMNKSHHPESWDPNYKPEPVKSWDARRHPKQVTVDAREMNDIAIIEMCCDFYAQGYNFGNSAGSWAKRCKELKTYIFDDSQWDLIFDVCDIVDD